MNDKLQTTVTVNVNKTIDWRDKPITDRQISALKMADDYFTFDMLEGLTRGEAYDYISEYYVDDRLDLQKRNKRYKAINVMGNGMNQKDKNDVRTLTNALVKEIINKAAKTVYGENGL